VGNYATPWMSGVHDDPAVARVITRLIGLHCEGATWHQLGRDYKLSGADLRQAVMTFMDGAAADDNDHLWPVHLAFSNHLPCDDCRSTR
jgi:hypothetical protein